MSQDLLEKYKKDANFRRDMDIVNQRYKTIQQTGSFSDLSCIPEHIIKKLPDRDIYIYLGLEQPTSQKLLNKLAMFLFTHFKPDVSKPYKFVFFNQLCPDNYVLWNFREIFCKQPIQIIAAMDQMIVVKPYFYHKAMDWMTFGTVPKYIKSKTKFCHTIKILCENLNINVQDIIKQLPSQIFSEQFPELVVQSLPLLRQNISGQQRGIDQIQEMQQFHKTINSMLIKPGNQISCISDYEMSEIGVPIILKMLLFYFQNNPQSLKLQGLFRKSVSIDEQTQTIKKIKQHNYDYLLSVENPHIIANLIKRFFSTLKQPIIPFDVFDFLMGPQKVQSQLQHLQLAVDKLPDINKRVLIFLMNFLNNKVAKNESQNKMGTQNLAICFGPCLLRSREINQASIMHAAKSPMFAKLMMTNIQDVFGNEEKVEDLYRRSFDQAQKSFDEILDIGIQQTMKTLQNLQQTKTTRCSSNFTKQEDNLNFISLQQQQCNEKKQQKQQPQFRKQNGYQLSYLQTNQPKKQMYPRLSRDMNNQLQEQEQEKQEQNEQKQTHYQLPLLQTNQPEKQIYPRLSRDMGNLQVQQTSQKKSINSIHSEQNNESKQDNFLNIEQDPVKNYRNSKSYKYSSILQPQNDDDQPQHK